MVKRIERMTDCELVLEVESMMDLGCKFGLKELLHLDACETELERRGFGVYPTVEMVKPRQNLSEEIGV